MLPAPPSHVPTNDQSQQANKAKTACLRCREHKLRCSRELPQCARCTATGSTCAFPLPPDRKSIAVLREHRKRQAAVATSSSGYSGELQTDRKRRQSSHSTPQGPASQPATSDKSRVITRLDELDAQLHQLLQEIYFTCMFNSFLTFHRPTFEAEFTRNSVPEHCLQAMYAFATNFLWPECPLGQKHRIDIGKLGDLRDLGEEWANAAGRAALQNIDQPTVAAVQTCQILILFWFSRGEARRNTMFAGIAYRAIRTIIMEAESYHVPFDRSSSPYTSLTNTSWLEMERLRRCFWASWQTVCVNSDSYATGVSTDPQVTALLLPISEDAYARGEWEESTSLREAMLLLQKKKAPEQSLTSKRDSIIAELMILVSLWARIRDHMDARRSDAEKEDWNNAFLIQNELTRWEKQLHHSLQYSQRNLFEHLVVKQRPIFTFFHALYHQCCLVLQASLVPSLSGAHLQDNMPQAAVRISAEVALHHAKALSRLGADIISLEWEPARIAPFVGYCMYVAATVHLTVLVRDETLAEKARSDLAASLALLKAMKPYWVVLEQLWTRINHLYDMRLSRKSQSSTPNADKTHGPRSLGSADDLVGSDAEDSGVNSLLEDSVLQFSIRKLQKTSSPDDQRPSPSTSALEKTLNHTSEGQIASILESNNGYFQESHQEHDPRDSREAAQISRNAQPFTWQEVTANESSSNVTATTAANLPYDTPTDNIFTLLNNGSLDTANEAETWWQQDMVTNGQAQFPFNDLFGMSLALQ